MERSDCPISCTLDLIGDKWTLVIIRDAIYKGYTTYGQFQSSPEGIATNILASRLNRLVDCGIFKKQKDKTNKLRIHYILTDKGHDLQEVLNTVALWGNSHIRGTQDVRDQLKR